MGRSLGKDEIGYSVLGHRERDQQLEAQTQGRLQPIAQDWAEKVVANLCEEHRFDYMDPHADIFQ